jgi:catechol 2,3-dioxygenase-like lactoylglutathione lyase family enzyme
VESASLSHSPVRAAPCLLVDDIQRAVDYYRTVLAFTEVQLLGEPPAEALVRREGATVLLQQAEAATGRHSHRRFADRSWDALFFVDGIERLAADLRRRGANIQVGLGITDVSDRTLEIRDDWGNVLAFAEASVGLRPAVRRAAVSVVPAPVRRKLRERRRAREEREHLLEFQAFHDGLANRRDPFYMFFTERLLHWVVNAERHVPRDVNLVLIGSALPDEEQRWLREHLDRPFHNIRLGVDDNTTWEFLFATNRQNFGYLDIDCFVLQPKVFQDIARISPDVAANGIWTYDAAPGVTIACSHFVFINMQVVDELRRRGCFMSPTNYDWDGSTISLLHPRTYCRVPTAAQRRLMLRVLPADEHGRPRPPAGMTFFDTLVAFQVAAHACGFGTHRIRPLEHRTQLSLGETTGEHRVWQQDMSDELIHVGGVSYYQRYFHSPQLRGMYLAAEYAMLHDIVGQLPERYRRRLDRLATELAHLGLVPDDAADIIDRHLVADRGLSPAASAKVLGRIPRPSAAG